MNLTNRHMCAKIYAAYNVVSNFFAGCSFTKYVKELCTRLGIVGWTKNTKTGTIIGKMQGPQAVVDQM